MTGQDAGPLAFAYVVLRAMPRVDRGEFVNIGIVLYCQQADFLDAGIDLAVDRIRAISADADLTAIRAAADAVQQACRGPVGSARENIGRAHLFGRLSAPRSTVVQPSPVHAGVTRDPAASLRRLVARLVSVDASTAEAP